MWVILVVDAGLHVDVNMYLYLCFQRAQWSGACWPTLQLAVLSLWVVDSRCSSSFLASTRSCKTPSQFLAQFSGVLWISTLISENKCVIFLRGYFVQFFSISLVNPVIMPIKVSWMFQNILSCLVVYRQLPCKEAPYLNWKVTDLEHICYTVTDPEN